MCSRRTSAAWSNAASNNSSGGGTLKRLLCNAWAWCFFSCEPGRPRPGSSTTIRRIVAFDRSLHPRPRQVAPRDAVVVHVGAANTFGAARLNARASSLSARAAGARLLPGAKRSKPLVFCPTHLLDSLGSCTNQTQIPPVIYRFCHSFISAPHSFLSVFFLCLCVSVVNAFPRILGPSPPAPTHSTSHPEPATVFRIH
jgi:hypothetical protein